MILCFGELIAFWLNYGFNYLQIDDWWRIPLAIQILPAMLLAVGCWYWIPPSPRWLVAQDRHECAREVLVRLHGTEAADFEMQEIRNSIDFERQVTDATWLDMFKFPVLKVTLLGMGIQFFQQITGTNSILYYTVIGSVVAIKTVGILLTNIAFPLRTRRNFRSAYRQPCNRWRRYRSVRLCLDPNLLLRPPRPQNMAANRYCWHDVLHDRHHRPTVARRAPPGR
jgi:MFS family permease